MTPEHLFRAIHAVLTRQPGVGAIMAAPVYKRGDRISGIVLALSLEDKHDAQIAKHYKALLGRLLELYPTEHAEMKESIRDAIAACKSADEVEIRIL